MPTPRRIFLKSSAVIAASVTLPGAPFSKDNDDLLPNINLGRHRVSRLIIGDNPFYGYSHFNKLFSEHMTEWSTPEHVCQTLRQCETVGINTWQITYKERAVSDLQKHREGGGKIQFLVLGNHALEEDSSLIPKMAKLGAIGIVHHGVMTSRRWRAGEQSKIIDFIKAVRNSGVMTGVSVHDPAILDSIESQNWDVDFFMTALYNRARAPEELERILGKEVPLGEAFLPGDPEKMCKVIRQSRKVCLAYKVLAAGRLIDSHETKETAFRFALENIKPTDGIIVGMYPRFTDQVKESADMVRSICGRPHAT